MTRNAMKVNFVFLFLKPLPGPLACICLEQFGFKFHRLRTDIAHFHLAMHKCNLAPPLNCECKATKAAPYQAVSAYLIHRAPQRAQGLMVLDGKTQNWLNTIVAST